MLDLARYMEEKHLRIDAELDRLIPAATVRPQRLHEAMRYSIFCGGKRIRPILCIAAAEAVGASGEVAMLPAVALECLHTYTLIHDDLPAMDNDDLRRGNPTSHKVFGEANAILAGDALLTLAFELIAQTPEAGRLGYELASASGSRGLAGGQYEDLASEGKTPDEEQLQFIHIHKTAKLICAACRMGGIAGGGSESMLEALGRYGDRIGIAFQVADDILNATSTPEMLGKAVGSDAARGKMTYVALYGIDRARRKAQELLDEALASLKGFPGPTEPLAALAYFMVDRDV